MRITGGQLKGRALASPRGLKIRPSSDLVREAIFNILGQDLAGLKALDLFAGTGGLGIETLSRGAHLALFIDISPQSIKLINRNLALCGYESSGFVLKRDLRKGIIRSHHLLKDVFDLVFLDPPYRKDFIPPLLEELSTKGFLSSESCVVAESSKGEKLPVSIKGLQMTDTRSYGDTRISIYAYEVKRWACKQPFTPAFLTR